MELSCVLLVMGLIGMKIAETKQELLPAPTLTLLTRGVIYRGQITKMNCTAPSNFQESTFYLQIRDNAALIQRLEAPASQNFVIFDPEITARGNYVCRYQAFTRPGVREISQTSNLLQLTVIDYPVATTTSPSPAKITAVPHWIFVLVGVVAGIVVLVMSVTLAVCITRIYNKKKKIKQREKESVWTPRDMATDWSYDNMVYRVTLKPPSDPEYSRDVPLPNKEILGETWTERNFSSFHSS